MNPCWYADDPQKPEGVPAVVIKYQKRISGPMLDRIDIQRQRFIDVPYIICTADMRVGEMRQFCRLQDEGQSLMRAAMRQMNLSARLYHLILKLARTIADLAGSEEIQSPHLVEALQYRPKIMVG